MLFLPLVWLLGAAVVSVLLVLGCKSFELRGFCEGGRLALASVTRSCKGNCWAAPSCSSKFMLARNCASSGAESMCPMQMRKLG